MSNDDRIEQKLDILDMRLDSMDKTLVKQELNLQTHMQRSDHLEALVDSIQKEFKPVQKHVIMVEGVLKFMGVISIFLGIVIAILQLLKVI